MGTELACLGEILKNKNIFTYIILFIAVRPVICFGKTAHLKSLM